MSFEIRSLTKPTDDLVLETSHPPEQAPHQLICHEALDWQTPIGRVCLQTVFSQIPKNLLFHSVDFWPEDAPENAQAAIKKNLLANPLVKKSDIDVCESMLNEATLQELASTGYNHVLNIVGACVQEARPYLAANEPLQIVKIIRKNVERDPRLNAQEFVNFLAPLIFLLKPDLTAVHKEQLVNHVNFLKCVCEYSILELSYKVHPADNLLIFVLQLSSRTDPDFINEFLSECEKEKALTKLEGIIDKEGQIHLPTDRETSAISSFIIELHELTNGLGDRAFITLLNSLVESVKAYQADDRSGLEFNNQLMLWKFCGDVIYGFNSPLLDLPIYKQALDSFKLRPNASATEMWNHLKMKMPPNLADKMYKMWWYGQYRFSKPIALAERMIDWMMRDLLETENQWGLTSDGAVAMVKDRFRKSAPILPFNPQRAESEYFSLHTRRKVRKS